MEPLRERRTAGAALVPPRLSAALLVAFLVGILFAIPLGAAPGLPPTGATRPDHSEYDRLLREYVAPGGVRYAAWRRDPADRLALKHYVQGLEALPIGAVDPAGPGRHVALAFWINLYNAATLDLVLDAFPVKSIRDLADANGSPWQQQVVTVEGRSLSLDAIENDVVRPTFRDPRVHFALNCAARSCPPLRAGAYFADSLDAQLDEQVQSFLHDGGAVLDGDGQALRLSKIFDWYGKDFEAASGSVIAWLRLFVPALAALPETSHVALQFRNYDWFLNESREP